MCSKSSESSNTEGRDSEFLALLNRHGPRIATYVHGMIPSWHDAEDIIQEAQLQLWREFGKFRPGSDFTAWACTLARYVAYNHVRRSQRKPLLFSSDIENVILDKMVRTSEQTDRRLEMLRDCVKKLGTDALDLLQRCYVDKERIKDIAAELGRSLTGTYSALSRIRHELFDCMRDRLHREEGP
jgi:RNA polymerase sigma-70 factor, ECF subfamily